MELHTVDETIRDRQAERLRELKESRDNAAVENALSDLKRAAEGSDNLLYPMKDSPRRTRDVGRGFGYVASRLRGVPALLRVAGYRHQASGFCLVPAEVGWPCVNIGPKQGVFSALSG